LKQNSRSGNANATIRLAVRNAAILAALALISGCGDATRHAASLGEVVAAPRVERGSDKPVEKNAAGTDVPSASLPSLPGPGSSSGSVSGSQAKDAPLVSTAAIGALERPAALRHFFEALARLDQGQSHEDVRLVQFGDSHTAADYETGPIRRALQARFGDGGRGFVAVGNPWKKYVQEGLKNGCTPDWAPDRGKLAKGKFAGDGMYGLCGASLKASRGGARAWAEYSARSSRIELSYLTQPRGGSLDVFIDGSRAGRVSTRGHATESGFFAFDVNDGPHRVEVSTVGDGEVRLFGAILDRAQVGVTFDALGINGARVSNALTWNEQHMTEQLRHRSPDLVVLAYGTNEAGDDTTTDAYERQLVDMLGRIARAAPSAACMLLGPPDRAIKSHEGWSTLPKLIDVIATQQRVASAAGCAFYNQLEAMGGPGAIAAWAEESPPRAGRDRVHLTRDGYSQLAGAVSTDLLRAYAAWRAESGLPAIAAPSVAPSTVPRIAPPTPLPSRGSAPLQSLQFRGNREPVAGR
jgi:lysophospholipase L1-like esterase